MCPEGTRRGKSCSTVHRPDKAIPDMLLVGGIEDERGGRVSRQEATISRGCGEEEERDNERQNTSSVFAWLVFSNWLVVSTAKAMAARRHSQSCHDVWPTAWCTSTLAQYDHSRHLLLVHRCTSALVLYTLVFPRMFRPLCTIVSIRPYTRAGQ